MKLLRKLFFVLIAKPLVLVLLGINIRDRHLLPTSGPAVIVANHNSHLDTLALVSLFSITQLDQIHPVAAADYFLKNRFIKWFAIHIIGIIPIERNPTEKNQNLMLPLIDALKQNSILLLFPEGSRGEPESLAKLKNGIGRLISECPEVPVIPVFFHGLGKALPKGEIILIPFFIDAFVGDAIHWSGSRLAFMQELQNRMTSLQTKAKPAQNNVF
jgi:1-acyl-sn-glycerol-3-phosphate acyltransferase